MPFAASQAFIWAISAAHAVEASLGYYIYPLVSAVIGFVLFRPPNVLSHHFSA